MTSPATDPERDTSKGDAGDGAATRPARRVAVGRGCGISLGVLALAAIVYATSVPAAFNTVYENRRFFDSDGEFIIRQFRKDKTFTHNDHLLYHALGRKLVGVFERRLSREDSILWGHLSMSILFGAIGLAAAYRVGRRLTGTRAGALAGCVLLGGSAGYWFFASTVDTYIPSLCFCILSIGAALDCLARRRARDAARLGAYAGLAFLFRTDGFLVIFLGPALLIPLAGAGRRAAACLATGIVVGLLGYASIAQCAYGVKLRELPQWAFAHDERPESEAVWGRAENINARNLKLMIFNSAIYSVILPGLENTRDRHYHQMMARIRLGRAVLYVYLCLLVASLIDAARGMWRDARSRRWDRVAPPALALAWFFSHVVFYAWWDPHDPFLFSVMNLPALWLLWLVYLRGPAPGGETAPVDAPRPPAVRTTILWIVAAIVLAHNLAHLIRPLRQLPAPAAEAMDKPVAAARGIC